MAEQRWNVDEVAEYLEITVDEVRDLVDAGFLHFSSEPATESFEVAHVKDWRRGLGDAGAGGPAYVRALLKVRE